MAFPGSRRILLVLIGAAEPEVHTFGHFCWPIHVCNSLTLSVANMPSRDVGLYEDGWNAVKAVKHVDQWLDLGIQEVRHGHKPGRVVSFMSRMADRALVFRQAHADIDFILAVIGAVGTDLGTRRCQLHQRSGGENIGAEAARLFAVHRQASIHSRATAGHHRCR